MQRFLKYKAVKIWNEIPLMVMYHLRIHYSIFIFKPKNKVTTISFSLLFLELFMSRFLEHLLVLTF